jgi:hypothetical protein
MLNRQARNLPADMIENASAILRERGIYADAHTIPAGRPADYIYEVVYSEEYHLEILRSFLRAPDGEIIHSDRQTPTGPAFSAGDYKIKFSFADDMQLEIVKSDYWEGDADGEAALLAAGYTGFGGGEANRVGRIIRDFLGRYPGQDARTGFEIIGLKNEGGRDKVLINQTASPEGLLISSHSAFLIISGGEVKYFSGRWYFGAFADSQRIPLLDSVNILFRSLEQDGASLIDTGHTRLEKMSRQYNVIDLGRDGVYLAPSWVLTFAGTGTMGENAEDVRTLSYNMIMGNKNN